MSEQDQIQNLQNKVSNLQQQLRAQQKLASLGMLVAGIAHEIQNPLNFVINFSKLSNKLLDDMTEILEDNEDKLKAEDREEIDDITADLQENLKKIQEYGERSIGIIHSILLQSRGKEDEFLPTRVDQLVHEYVWLSYHSMRANDKNFNVSLHESYPDKMPQLMVIPQDLCRAVLNVMNNACYTVREKAKEMGSDYMPTIEVKMTYEKETLTLILADNGMGIAEEVKEKIFHEIITTKPAGQGTGLGMYLTWDIIVNKHKGKILLDTHKGKGSTFTFIIPAKSVK